MHEEILNAAQQELLPLMAQFRQEYYLVGGTAIALHIGHRRSVDFDLFKMSAINHKKNGCSGKCGTVSGGRRSVWLRKAA